MKITEIWKSKQKPTVSFEIFPARTPEGEAKLERVIDQLMFLEPDFMGVTFGAGGSTREGSRNLIDKLLHDKDIEVVAYLACYGLWPDDILAVMDCYQDLGVENILAVRGDAPHGQPDFQPHPASLAHASDLLALLRPRYSFCLGAAGYPEGHIDAASLDKDIEYLKLKVDNGAEFIITNYFYDNEYFFNFMEKCRRQGIHAPILPGIMPIYSLKMMENLAKLCGATITAKLRQGLNALPEGDTQALLNFGIEYALEQCRELIKAGVPGLHFYTMDRSQSSAAIVAHLRHEDLL